MKKFFKQLVLIIFSIGSFSLIFVSLVILFYMVLPIIFKSYDGFSDDVHLRLQINEIVDYKTVIADILSHSATMDGYMINWTSWDKYNNKNRKIIGDFTGSLKIGDKIIGVGGRSGYDANGSILKLRRIMPDRFEPFGTDWRYGFCFLLLLFWITANLIVIKHLVKL